MTTSTFIPLYFSLINMSLDATGTLIYATTTLSYFPPARLNFKDLSSNEQQICEASRGKTF
jgi:hypothetical protein